MTDTNFFNPIYKNLLLVPNLLLVVCPIILLGGYSFIDLLINFEYYKLFYLLAGYFIFMVMGITAGYHRYFSHKSFTVNPWKRKLLMVCGALAGQGSPIFWVALHRGYHHRKSDQPQDLHSPIYGNWHAMLLWMFRIKPGSVNPKYALELLRDPFATWIHNNYIKIFLGFNLALVLLNVDMLLYFSMAGCFVTLCSYNITNWACHVQSFGYKNFKNNDNSVNVPWLWPLVLGECWHNNHHARPGSTHFGSAVSGKWWEIDPSGWFIKLFQDHQSKDTL